MNFSKYSYTFDILFITHIFINSFYRIYSILSFSLYLEPEEIKPYLDVIKYELSNYTKQKE